MAQDDPNADLKTMGIMVGTIAMFSFIIWYFFEEHIKSAIRWLRIGEMRVIAKLLKKEEKESLTNYADSLEQFQHYLTRLSPEQKESFYASRGSHFVIEPSVQVLDYIALPVALILGAMGMYMLIKGTSHAYKRKMNLETMIESHAEMFPVTAPIVRFNPLQNSRPPGSPVPAKLPLFAEALSPEEWASYHAIPMPDNKLDKRALHKAFSKQLKGRWRGASKLPIHLQALFVACAMKANGLRTEADDFLGEVSKCWRPKRNKLILTAKLKKEIRKKINHPKYGRVMDKVAAQHSFITPAMMRMLQMAREEGGVMAPASFLWLRAVDRTVWYPLNNLGRGSFHIEALGAHAHYKAERAANRPIPTPQMASAVDSILGYFEERMPVLPPRNVKLAKT